jgi:hypothetical protein
MFCQNGACVCGGKDLTPPNPPSYQTSTCNYGKVLVCHFPPGTSKWNKIEHRMFCKISENWRARPLVNLQTIIELIGNTTTTTGLKIKAMIDTNTYEKGRKISDEDFKSINLEPMKFHGEWNYIIKPSIGG